jgi:polysaccharide chain length determinant protein (PEP-CTERM system associated)
MRETLNHILSEVRSCWRFRWYAAIAAWGIGAFGLVVVAWLPDIYEASARVYVDGTSVLRPLLNDRIVAPDVATHLMFVRQSLLGREYLERVANENGLVSPTMRPAEIEDVLERLRTDVLIDAVPANPENDRAPSTIFTIRFRDERPEVAVGIVRSFTNSLIEDTLGADRQGTDMAARFLDDRIAEHEARLQKAEQELAEFQRANSGRLPGSEGTYFERMERERESLESARRDLRLAQSRRDRLEQQLTSEAPLTVERGLENGPPPNSIDARIRDQHAELDQMMLKYTERHPAVVALKDSLARLEAQRAEQLRALGIENPDQQISVLGANPVYQAVQIALNDVDVQIATLEADVRDREQRLRNTQALIDEVPRVEADLARLNRDYNVIKEQYQALIQSRERQQLSQQASASDQPDFRVLNPPRAEIEPVAPPRLLLLVGVLGAALAGGAGVSWMLAQIRPVFSTAKALREIGGFPVIGSVSRVLVDSAAASRRRWALLSFAAAIGGLVLLVVGVAAFELVGPGIHSLVGGA